MLSHKPLESFRGVESTYLYQEDDLISCFLRWYTGQMSLGMRGQCLVFEELVSLLQVKM